MLGAAVASIFLFVCHPRPVNAYPLAIENTGHEALPELRAEKSTGCECHLPVAKSD